MTQEKEKVKTSKSFYFPVFPLSDFLGLCVCLEYVRRVPAEVVRGALEAYSLEAYSMEGLSLPAAVLAGLAGEGAFEVGF